MEDKNFFLLVRAGEKDKKKLEELKKFANHMNAQSNCFSLVQMIEDSSQESKPLNILGFEDLDGNRQ